MADFGLNRRRQAPAEDTPSFGGIAERFRRAGDLDRAIALCQEGLKKFPNQLSARVTLGWAFLDRGEYDLARAELEKVLRRAPDNLAAIRGMAELHDRAEHTAPSAAAVGHWHAPEEAAAEEPAPAPAPVAAAPATPERVVAVAPSAPQRVSVATPAPAAPEPVFVAVPAAPELVLPREEYQAPEEDQALVVPADPLPAVQPVVVDTTDPLSLIETPAEAAVARSSHAVPAPPPSVFEKVLDRIAEEEPVELSEPDPEPVDLVWTSDKTDAPLPDLSEFDLNGWSDSPEAVAANLSQSQSIPPAQAAKIDPAPTAPDLSVRPSDEDLPVVIDLPAIEVGLEGGLEQFEQVLELDPDLPPAEQVVSAIAIEGPQETPTASAAESVPANDIVAAPESLGEAVDDAVGLAVAAEAAEVAKIDTADVVAVAAAEAVAEVPRVEDVAAVAAITDVDEADDVEGIAVLDVEDITEVEEVDEEDDLADDLDELDADEPAGAPANGWVSPAVLDGNGNGHHLPSVSALSSLELADASPLPPPIHIAPPPAAASKPLAALEGFLRKVSTRRLHLNPGSVA